MKKTFLTDLIRPATLLALLLLSTAFVADKPAYRLFDRKGKTTSYEKLLDRAAEADVVLFGELHNNPICHWLEVQLAQDLYQRRGAKLVLGAEMFEADNQQPLSDYVAGRTTGKELAQQARLWPNYETDYQPIVEMAREYKLTFVATNVPRRYASLVSRRGLSALDTLSAEAKTQMAPLPISVDLTLPGYANMLKMMAGPSHGDHGGASAGSNPHAGNDDMADRNPAANFARAQALKDATMAHFILKNWSPGQTLLHLNGAYHSNNFEGIGWYLKRQRPDLKIVTISSVDLDEAGKLTDENRGLADFTIAIPANMTKTY
jgi:uncharacterized iron-regulated protein